MTVFMLIMCFILFCFCAGRCVHLSMESDELRTLCEMYQNRYEELAHLYYKSLLRPKSMQQMVMNTDVLDAVNYARMKAHPDNGGSAERFQRYNKLYNEIKRGCK